MAEALAADLLVIGAGMAGMTAAGYAAEHGATVVVVEKAHDIGGSAILSNGNVWTAATEEAALATNPYGIPDLVRTLVRNYDEGIDWVRRSGTEVSEPQAMSEYMGFPARCFAIDILGYVERMRARVLAAGGWVVTDADVEELLIEAGAVVGARVRDRDGVAEIGSPWTLLSSGGFQNDAVLRREFLGPSGAELLVRSNPHSSGAGLRLGRAAGARLSPHMDSFYGHIMAWPLRTLEPKDFIRLAQLYSPHCVLLDFDGNRFVDESIAYHENARAISRVPAGRALLVGDESIRAVDRAGYGLTEQIDRPDEAALEGAHVAEADTFEGLEAAVADWGYRDVAPTLHRFNQLVVERPVALEPGRRRNRRPLSDRPYFAMEVQPTVTFTMGGLLIDAGARVLKTETGDAVQGLLAAGADAGGLYHDAYLGGLAMALVFGMQAARTAVESASPGGQAPAE